MKLIFSALFFASISLVSAAELRTYRCDVSLNVENLYPASSTADQVVDTYYKGHFDDPKLKEKVRKTLLLRGKPVVVTTTLKTCAFDQATYIEMPSVVLPECEVGVRSEWERDQSVVQWERFRSNVSSTGYVDLPGEASITWPVVTQLLTGRTPSGPVADDIKVGTSQVALRQTAKPEDQRYVLVTYSDPGQRSISRIQAFWNHRTKRPFYDIQLVNAKIQGERISFDAMTLSRFANGKCEDSQVYRLNSVVSVPETYEVKLPVGQSFLDRRAGPENHRTFTYDGRKFPSLDDTKSYLREAKSLSTKQDWFPTFQFLGGGALATLGIGLWSFSKKVA